MPHARKQIRDAAVTALTGLTTTGARVYPSRAVPVQEDRLPALLVYTREETSGVDTIGGAGSRGLQRICSLRVEGICQSIADLDDQADDIAAEVETALAADPSLGGLAKDLQLTQTEIGFTDEGGQPIAGVRMIFAVQYRTRERAPSTAI